jgi:DNA-binding PadR family transcriptional regulator
MKKEQTRLRRYYRILLLVSGSEVPLNKYMIWKDLEQKTRESEPTILYAIRDLEEWGFIRRLTSEKRARGGGKSYHYELTRLGLEGLIPLVDRHDEEKFFKDFAVKYRKLLPEICKVLPIFEKAGIRRGEIAWRLRSFSTYFHGDPLRYYVDDPFRDKRPVYYGVHGRNNEKEYASGQFYRCTDLEDAQEFVNPFGHFQFFYYRGADEDQKKLLEIVRSNETLLALAIQGGLREAQSYADRAHSVMTDLCEELKPVKDWMLKTEVSDPIDRLRTSLEAAQRQLSEVQKTLRK